MVVTQEAVGNKTRYSDTELKEFEDIITQKITEAEEIIQGSAKELRDLEGDNTSHDAALNVQKEELSHLIGRQRKFISQLQNAMVRIKTKTYGICSQTGKLIPKERLRAVPHTTLCIEAKKLQNAA